MFCFVHFTPGSNGYVKDIEEGEERSIPASLEDIVIFTTGASDIPPIGFEEEPSIVFKTGGGGDLSCSSTY